MLLCKGMEKIKRLRSNPAILGWITLLVFIWKVLGGIDTLKSVVQDMSNVWDFLSTPLGMLALLVVGLGLVFYSVFKPVKLIENKHAVLSPQEVALKRESDWLLEVLAFNQRHIYEAVRGRIARWNFSGLTILEDPYFEIHFQLFNTSIFTLDFKGVEGEIKIEGITCRTKPTANSPQRAITQGQDFYVIVTQAVLPEMAKKILDAANKKEKLNFDLSQLELSIETTTKNYEGLKPRIKFQNQRTPDIAAWLSLQGDKLGYWT